MDTTILHLDTYKIVKLLQSKGYTKKEAEGFIEAIQEINLIGVVTKQDIADLENKVIKAHSSSMELQLIKKIASHRYRDQAVEILDQLAE